jgi:hypothetical protein
LKGNVWFRGELDIFHRTTPTYSIQKDTYNKRIFIEKNIDDKNILATLKKHSYFFKCGILKPKKFKDCFKIAFRISRVLYHI